GSQGGRLFLDLREAKGLAYLVWATAMDGVDGGLFCAGLATEPRREKEARLALAESLHHLAANQPSIEELNRARRMLVGQAAMGLQRCAGRAASVAFAERLGLRWGIEPYRQALNKVEPAQVSQVLNDVLEGGTVEIVVVPKVHKG
ncbi:MAG: insulinase family protein, partial [Proteobacteria bacterium]|nr:insulinase family protein [Pseudomonadota bacterium]